MELTIVELNTDYVPTMNTDVSLIKKGTRGVIVHVYKEPYYEVEFEIDGKSVVETIMEDELDFTL